MSSEDGVVILKVGETAAQTLRSIGLWERYRRGFAEEK
jgi:hypothetical protein